MLWPLKKEQIDPRSASTTNPVASLVNAGSVSKEHVWQKRIETTFLTTFSMAACHSAVSARPGMILGSSSSMELSSSSYIEVISGVFWPADSLPFNARCCFCGLSVEDIGGCLRLARVVPFVPFILQKLVLTPVARMNRVFAGGSSELIIRELNFGC